MCLIITLVMLGVAIQSFIQHQWMSGVLQLIIALGFLWLLIRNIIAVRNQKQGCTTTGCSITDWFTALFKKREE
ncbi:MAG TPA: hypothetical protein VIN02_02210 [Sulfurovum sp.]